MALRTPLPINLALETTDEPALATRPPRPDNADETPPPTFLIRPTIPL